MDLWKRETPKKQLCESSHIAWTFLRFVALQPQTWMYFGGNRTMQSRVKLRTRIKRTVFAQRKKQLKSVAYIFIKSSWGGHYFNPPTVLYATKFLLCAQSGWVTLSLRAILQGFCKSFRNWWSDGTTPPLPRTPTMTFLTLLLSVTLRPQETNCAVFVSFYQIFYSTASSCINSYSKFTM